MNDPTWVERFWSHVDQSGSCWEWQSTKTEKGYGRFDLSRNVHRKAHRLSYELAHGPLPARAILDHTCHNRACVNPDHLRIVTNKQNIENRSGAQSNSATGVRGVSPMPDGRYRAKVGHNGKTYYLGLFSDLDQAAAVVRAKRNELFTHNDADRI